MEFRDVLVRIGLATLGITTLAIGVSPATAQQSANFSLTENTFNSGGTPRDGGDLSSASFAITLSALGDAALARDLSSASFSLDGGFVFAMAPVGEVAGLNFIDPTTLNWTAAPTALSYNAYRDLVSNLAGLGFGSCTQQDLPTPQWSDIDVPPVEDGYFYLITGINRLAEEGTKGNSSSGTERLGSACP